MKKLIILLFLLPVTSQAQIDSLDLKIGQMILIGLDEFDKLDKKEPMFDDIEKGIVGNFVVFEKHINKKSPAKSLRKITEYIQKISPIKPLIAIDEEGGRVNRLKPKYDFPKTVSQQYLGELGNDDSLRHYARLSAETMSELGINVNFAPVLDVNINTENPVIGMLGRSYSSDFAEVSRLAELMIEEQSKLGIINCVKHFPGHGSSADDSHYGMADVSGKWRMEELYPYRDLIRQGRIKMIMTAHIVNAQLDESLVPATLSRKVITEVLRNFMQYEGVVVTDAMEMQAISKHYGVEEAVVMAINAGVDMVVFGNNGELAENSRPRELHDMIKNNVRSGKIPMKRIDESYKRIMKLKNSLK